MIAIPFATIAEADAYHADHLFGATWLDEMEVSDKQKALVTASRLLLAHVPWMRNYITYTAVAAQDLKDATSEFARRLFERGDPFTVSDTSDIKSMKAGPVDIEFSDLNGALPDPVPNEVLAMLSSIAPYAGSSFNVPLVRF